MKLKLDNFYILYYQNDNKKEIYRMDDFNNFYIFNLILNKLI